MGSTITKLSDKYYSGNASSNKQESKEMLRDMILDESEINMSSSFDSGDHLEISRTPPNIVKLKCDPRSPTDFNRTPLKVPITEQ